MSGGLRLRVFDPTNTTFIGELVGASEVEFVDEFNAPGYGTCRVLLDSADANLLQRDRVVQVVHDNATRFSWIVEVIDRTLVDATGQKLLRASGRGILAWLEDAIVYPQAGLRENFIGDRPFNFASEDGPWTGSASFTSAVGVRWRDDTTTRQGLPRRWPDSAAFWIWKTNPASQNVPQGTINWMRKSFTLTERTRIVFYATADNFFELYLDGQEVMSSSRFTEQAPTFAQMTRYAVTLGAGDHILAARVRNGKPWQREDLSISASSDKVSASNHGLTNGTKIRFTEIADTGTGLSTGTDYYVRDVETSAFKVATSVGGSAVNITKDSTVTAALRLDQYAGFLCVGFKADADGKPDRTIPPIIRSNTSWQVADTEPQWRPAMILRELIEEGQARGVYRFNKFTFSYDTASPTSGAWSTYIALSVKVGAHLLQIHDEMVDLGIDFWINPVTCQINAAEARGTDKSATIRLLPAKNLLAFETSAERKLKTTALIQYRDGWTQAGNNVATLGRRETYLEMGRTRSDSTAKIRAQRFLDRTGKQITLATTVEAIVVDDCVPYRDFAVGDVIGIPSPDGSGISRARVVSLSMVDDQGTARFMPELEVL